MKNIKGQEYRHLCSELRDLEVKQEALRTKKRSMEAKTHINLKMTKKIQHYNQNNTQTKITCLFKPSPKGIAQQIIKDNRKSDSGHYQYLPGDQ